MTTTNAEKKVKKVSSESKKTRKKQASHDRAILCPPDAAGRSFRIRLLGMLCRGLVLFAATAGLCDFLCDAFFPDLNGSAILTCFLFSMYFALISLHRVSAIIGSVAGFGLLSAGMAFLSGGVFSSLIPSLAFAHNSAIDQFYKYGYRTFINYQLQQNYASYGETFAFLLAFLITLLFCSCLMRKSHIIAPAIFATGCLVLVFMYNIPVSNGSIAFMVSGFTAVLIMSIFDKIYNSHPDTAAFDDATLLFADERPPMPEGVTDKASERQKKKKDRQAQAEEKIRRSAELKTVEDELTDYFKPAKKAAKVKVKAPSSPKTDAERAKAKAKKAQLAAVRAYDDVTRQSRAAMGGFAGIAMLIVALLVISIPSSSVVGSFHTIEKIDRRVESVREYVTARLRGDDPTLDLYDYLEARKEDEPHSTTAETQEYQNIPLLSVGVQTNLPLYLTSWIGTDYEDGAWCAFTDDQYYAFRDLENSIKAMPAEEIRSWFLSTMQPDSRENAAYDYVTKYVTHGNLGFSTYMVNLTRLRDFSTSLLLPRMTLSEYGIKKYRSMVKADIPFAVVFDGITTSHFARELGLNYSVIAQVPNQKDNPEWFYHIASIIASYEASCEQIDLYEAAKNKRAFQPNYSLIRHQEGTNLAKTYIEGLTSEERRDILTQIEKERAYADFVYDTYLDTADSEIIRSYAAAIAGDVSVTEEIAYSAETIANHHLYESAAARRSSNAMTYVNRHLLTKAVIDSLVEKCNYTLEITAIADPTLDGVENFLNVTHEGYCVQFASAAALILRELGIPTRYVEGYICSDFHLQDVAAQQEKNRYTTTVRDSDAHAWIEVYFDGIGWIPYETTPSYYIDVYGRTSEIAQKLEGGEITPDPPVIDPKPPVVDPPVVDPTQPPITDPTTGNFGALLLVILKIAALVGGIALIVILLVWQIIRIVRSARREEQSRKDLLDGILTDSASVYATEDERKVAAHRLTRMTMGLLALYGTAPEVGEFKDDYARRLSFAYQDILGFPVEYSETGNAGAVSHEFISRFHISALMDAISAEEFGYGMTPKQMKVIAEFYRELRQHEKSKISYWHRLRLHYISKEI